MLKKLFPPDLANYVPGAKLIAGVVVYAATAGAQALGVDLSVVGITSESVQNFASLLAVYLWPNS